MTAIEWIDSSIAIIIILVFLLLVWSRVQNQKMLDTVVEIKEIFSKLNPIQQTTQ